MYEFDFIENSVRNINELMAYCGGTILVLLIMYEWLLGRYRDGKKTQEDWAMGAIAIAALSLVQRPLLVIVIFFSLTALFPSYAMSLRGLEQEYLILSIVLFLLIDEYLHGRAHLFAHSPRPKSKILRNIQAFYKVAHRPHHQVGGNDGRGELSVTQTFVEHWGWWLALPNYWFGIICLYFGLVETFFWGTLIKSTWGMHVHTNWGKSYDLALLNHSNPLVRRIMKCLCHVFVFPNMHHQHHSRGPNSAKNMTNFIAIYDWLLWKTLVIETQRPEIYGWKQSEKEEFNPFYRFFNTNLKRA